MDITYNSFVYRINVVSYRTVVIGYGLKVEETFSNI